MTPKPQPHQDVVDKWVLEGLSDAEIRDRLADPAWTDTDAWRKDRLARAAADLRRPLTPYQRDVGLADIIDFIVDERLRTHGLLT